MRKLIRFPCQGAQLSGSLDAAPGSVGLLCVTGGSQTRVGPHRLLERIANRIAAEGYPVLRYERRGVGDSEGDDPGYKASGPDLAAAAAAFRAEAPALAVLVGFGLCDGATVIALHGAEAGADAMILANPWLVETGADAPPPPAVARAHYRRRFLSPAAWLRLLRGGVNPLAALRSLLGGFRKSAPNDLAAKVAQGLAPFAGRVRLILASGDATAIAARACWAAPSFASLGSDRIVTIATDAHSFARPADFDKLVEELLAFLAEQSNRSA